MKVRKGLIAIAAGAILATAGAAFSAPQHDYYSAGERYDYGNGEQHQVIGKANDRLGYENIRGPEQREITRYSGRRGRPEKGGRQFAVREGEHHEFFGGAREHHEW